MPLHQVQDDTPAVIQALMLSRLGLMRFAPKQAQIGQLTDVGVNWLSRMTQADSQDEEIGVLVPQSDKAQSFDNGADDTMHDDGHHNGDAHKAPDIDLTPKTNKAIADVSDLGLATANAIAPKLTTPIISSHTNQQQDLAIVTKNKDEKSTIYTGIRADSRKFSLLGIGYGDWVILADKMTLDADSYQVWLSLSARLKQNTNTLSLEIHYPLVDNDYPDYAAFEQGSHALLGFLLRLCADKDTPKIALLSELSSGIHLGSLSQFVIATPTLAQMAQFLETKKDFWQLIHSSS